MMFACMDPNFRLKNQLVSNYSQDPGLGIGWVYMVPQEGYENYVLGQANNEDVSFHRCSRPLVSEWDIDQYLRWLSSSCTGQHPIFSRSALYGHWGGILWAVGDVSSRGCRKPSEG